LTGHTEVHVPAPGKPSEGKRGVAKKNVWTIVVQTPIMPIISGCFVAGCWEFEMAKAAPTRTLVWAVVPTALILVTVALFLVIRTLGADLSAAAPLQEAPLGKSVEGGGILANVLLALIVIVVCARSVGSVFAWLGQPRVIGEVLAGILLGPSCLGA